MKTQTAWDCTARRCGVH